MTESAIHLGQAFFGNDRTSYRLLACTEGNYAADIAKWCCAIGTPDGFSTMSPFLFSVPHDNVILMFCCRPGKPDESGRQTLFFHCLFADRQEADQYRLNAFSLWQAGYFSSEVPTPCTPLSLSSPMPAEPQLPRPPFPWNGEPLAIISSKEEMPLLRSLLGTQVNDVAWSGFSFQHVNSFRLYVLSQYVNRPDDRTCVTTSGQRLALQPERHAAPVPPVPPAPVPSPSSTGKGILCLLILSLLVNVILGYYAVPSSPKKNITPAHKPDNPPQEKVIATTDNQPPAAATPVITREMVLDELKRQFPKDKIITDLPAVIQTSDRLQMLRDNPIPDSREPGLFPKIETYINFVNHHILTAQTAEGTK